jgi:superfamily II DNA helicase RecQ
MRFTTFSYPIPVFGELDDLNQFLATHRVVSISKKIVSNGGCATLVFVVEYGSSTNGTDSVKSQRGESIDYQKILTPEQYVLFSRLRDLRKLIAAEEGIPIFAVFTNSQLAEMVQKSIRQTSDLNKISGLGKQRIQKHGLRLLAVITDVQGEPEVADAKAVESEDSTTKGS